MKIVSSAILGSHAYGMATPSSDIDKRGVFINTSIPNILGLDREDFVDNRKGGDDIFLWEFRHFLRQLRKTNTQAIELLFYSDKWLVLRDEFKKVIHYRNQLADKERLLVSMTGGEKANFDKGYIGNESRLAFGERTGKLGKRKEALEEFGFSPKNVVQMLRLCFCSRHFFETGYYPVRISSVDAERAAEIYDIKVNPANYSADQLKDMVDAERKKILESFDRSTIDLKFNEDLANALCLEVYKPFLK